MDFNPKLIIPLALLFSVAFSGCQLLESLRKDGPPNDRRMKCAALDEVSNNHFNELSSEMYLLTAVEQVNDRLIVNISSSLEIEADKLYWNGSVKDKKMPEASVKIVVKGTASEEGEKETRLCFDISKFKQHGEQVKLYFMDDEEVFVLDFKDNAAAMK